MVFADWLGSSRVRMTTPSASWSQRMVVLSALISDTLQDRGDAHAAADAQRGQAVTEVLALEFVHERAQDHAAGGAQRMAHGDRAAVDVDLVHVKAHVADEAQDDGGEGLVDLHQVEVIDGQPG